MKEFCTCKFGRVERRKGVIYCSSCDKPVCCAAAALNAEAELHSAEIADKDNFVCWYHHWETIGSVDASHLKSSTATW